MRTLGSFSALLMCGIGSLVIRAEVDRSAPRDTPKGETLHATASVEYSLKDTLPSAELKPGPFTVPKGYTAINLKYRWNDPSTNRTSDVIQETTVYSITRARYMRDLKGNPNATLPSGEYKVVCGGMVGATGVLTYTLVRDDLVANPDVNPPAKGERVIDITTWSPKPNDLNYHPKLKSVFRIKDGKVTGTIDQVIEAPKYGGDVTCDPIPIKGTFVGTISGNVIVGKWELKTGPHKFHFHRSGETPYFRLESSTQTHESRVTLAADGTVTESLKVSGKAEWSWSNSAPKELAGKSDKHTWTSEIPGKDHPEPSQGTWKERK